MDRTHDSTPQPDGGILAQRLEELVAATAVASLDMTAFYTPQHLARMLNCSDRTLDRRREKKLPPLWLPLEGLIRYPAWAFWAWLCGELRGQSSSLLSYSDERPGRRS